MSQENVELLQRGLGHFVSTGEPAWEQIHPNVEVYDHDIPDAGEYRGHAGYAKWLQDWADAWESYTAEPDRYSDAGDKVVVEVKMHATGGGSGIEMDRRDAIVFTVRDGLIVRLDYFNNPAEAREAAGLSE
jgi:ketosteroid isomerase-like protein